MNSDMIKSEKVGHLHLVYHFTVPLNRKLFPEKPIQLKFFDKSLSPITSQCQLNQNKRVT